jgi:fructokinase
MQQYIGIEGGGTKFVCAYGNHPSDLKDRTVIKTCSPNKTMQEIVDYIRVVQRKTDIHGIGLAVFAPLDLNPLSSTYGYITSTPKPGWQFYNIVGALKKAFHLPVGFDTDVNGAALGEYKWGAAKNINDFVYLTVGTGIGGGAMINGQLVHGAMHPEMGHLLIPQHPNDSFKGVCPYHQHCLEGLASGPAILARWNVSNATELPEHHEAWDLEAYYLGMGLANIIMTYSPKKIILGGGVMHCVGLLEKIRLAVLKSLNGYISCEQIINNINNYIVKPGLHDNSGICGAIALAENGRNDFSAYPNHAESAVCEYVNRLRIPDVIE